MTAENTKVIGKMENSTVKVSFCILRKESGNEASGAKENESNGKMPLLHNFIKLKSIKV
jgi:hypothetical protein